MILHIGSERYTFFWDIAIVDISKWISNIASCDAIFDFWISNIASCDAISKMWCDISFFEISPLSISQIGYGTSYHAMQCFGYLIYHHVMQCVDLISGKSYISPPNLIDIIYIYSKYKILHISSSLSETEIHFSFIIILYQEEEPVRYQWIVDNIETDLQIPNEWLSVWLFWLLFIYNHQQPPVL